MKKGLVLVPLVALLGGAGFWRGAAMPPITADTAAIAPTVPIEHQPSSGQDHGEIVPSKANGVLERMPASFRGTDIDGFLRTDASGNLIIDTNVRHTFDYFLAAIGEDSIEVSVARLRRYLNHQLPQRAEAQAIRLLSQYLSYKRLLLKLEQEHTQRLDLDALRNRLHAAKSLRMEIFSEQAHQAFFSHEEAVDTFTLERLAIQRDPALDAAAKEAAIAQLHAALPTELSGLGAPQLHTKLSQETQALEATGATPMEIRNLREQMVGTAATERLERLDESRSNWRHRLKLYRDEKAEIERSSGLSEADKRSSIDTLIARHFNENERLRLEAAEQLLAIKKKHD